MKRLVLLAGLLICAGCFTAAPPPEVIAPPPPARAAKTFPPVTPEQVNENNGHQTARAMEEEINREYQELMLTSSPR
jgi:hypothetical protein